MDGRMIAVLILVYFIYVVLGGVIFHFIETPNETEVKSHSLNASRAFLVKYPCVSPAELEKFVKTILQAYDQGVIQTNETSSTSNWDIGSAIFFSSTIVTTIGYGHIAPSTSGGRTFAVFYALIGIPLTLVLLGGIGEKQLKFMNWCFSKSTCKFTNKKHWKRIRTLVTVLIGIVLIMLIPAAIFYAVELDWTYGESVYYTFITISTIGFGDFVPGTNADDSYRGWYRLMTACWILIGLSWLSLVMNQLTENFSENVSKVESKLYIRDDEKSDPETGDQEKNGLENGVTETSVNDNVKTTEL